MSERRRRLAVECHDLILGVVEPGVPQLGCSRLAQALAACELATLYDLRARLALGPRPAAAA